MMAAASGPCRVVIVGGGFAGYHATRRLERLCRRLPAVEITLVSLDNYFLMTPLLFQAATGVLSPRDIVSPLRPLLRRARFIKGNVQEIDLDRRVLAVRIRPEETLEVPYDQLVLALGGVSNLRVIPGSEHALTLKTLIDALVLRNHVLDCFEDAASEPDPACCQTRLTFAIVGGGLVGVELLGELTAFVRGLCSVYPGLQHRLRFELIEAGPVIAPELDRSLADYAVRVFTQRGVHVRTGTPVRRIEPGCLLLPDGELLRAGTIVAATGVLPNPLVGTLPLELDHKGRIRVEPTLRTARPEVWALGDCAAVPTPDGRIYPPLAQHANRQAKVVADNIHAVLTGRPLRPFTFRTLGTLATLGQRQGVGQVLGWRLRGFTAWLLWRSYYLLQVPLWDRRLRILLDWALAAFFRADVAKVDLESEAHLLERLGFGSESTLRPGPSDDEAAWRKAAIAGRTPDPRSNSPAHNP